MSEAQSAFDGAAMPLCPAELASPALHRVLSYAAIQAHILGGKGVGSQGDGSAQLLCRNAASQQAVCEVLEAELGVHCMAFTVPASGADGTSNDRANGLAQQRTQMDAAP
jgi:galactokinase